MVAVVVLGQVVRWAFVRWSGGRMVLPCVIARSRATKQSPPRRLKRDERGAVLVQALFILPILILAVFGGYTIWKVAFVKHSLHSGTYQATRYLCLNPVDRPVRSTREEWEKAWEEVVVEFVAREVGNNGLADDTYELDELVATVDLDEDKDKLECGLRFTVKTELNLQIDIPYLSMPLTLWDQHEGWVECR